VKSNVAIFSMVVFSSVSTALTGLFTSIENNLKLVSLVFFFENTKNKNQNAILVSEAYKA